MRFIEDDSGYAESRCQLSRSKSVHRRDPPRPVQDNSFLIRGSRTTRDLDVVQHILNIRSTRGKRPGRARTTYAWSFVFTSGVGQLFSQTHQLSYTLPYTFLDEGGRSTNGIEDISLNYRLQVLMESETLPAFAPRLSLILPTGDEEDGLGNDTLGYQLNLPVSKIVSDRTTLHFNAGATLLPDVDGHDLVNYHLGASAIYAVTPNFNLMLEALAEWDEEVDDFDRTDREASVVISPGFRYAFNHPGDAQTVIGLAAPIGVTSAAPDFGVFIYASFEHFFSRPESAATRDSRPNAARRQLYRKTQAVKRCVPVAVRISVTQQPFGSAR
jgi:hypothetical protein